MTRPPDGPEIGDAAARKATGRGWDEWFSRLDAAGAAEWDHPRIAAGRLAAALEA